MCQLLGMNCNTPTDICFSFAGFQARGGLTDVHGDGWGIAFFEGRGVRVFLDPAASCRSPVAELVRQYPIRSLNVIAHIRKATRGIVKLENTHPFQRELWGRYWVFAHNGHLGEFDPPLRGDFRPVGQTDSERAFCFMLESLRTRFPDGEPARPALFAAIRELATAVSAHGEFNFLLSNGTCLFAHCASRLSYIVRQAPFAQAHLKDQDITVDFSELTTPGDRVAVVATTPLTDDEVWTPIAPGSLMLFVDGAPEAAGEASTRAFIRTESVVA
ncbi:MAG TPA: class II glutamine amidotransferase [Rhodocyclaceae bacterium]|uniref:class II glutamine amidotransferase n=1 Tax=Zoogloea sp. TaxID=49181 RepID=UPI002BCF30AB|nr:class II glutamine amidotransferase [Zoogloea sp.]HMV18096.1 class II glutamine amidotransferase [Rhodocyclaceae bacterium]HMV63692.1 class II glutamine amidotransferase [Rhodocyclaceae bacterium]HMW53878.1 class II glutamine amidotransferase [Rhodocyclaceae bacterium]HMY49017.1 class II glutamine amidotransferase [Rhodocyclaceae bacterium]HMZ75217.1 class II glutamine amidotransferase [Rhodocyclaceae bacterium]